MIFKSSSLDLLYCINVEFSLTFMNLSVLWKRLTSLISFLKRPSRSSLYNLPDFTIAFLVPWMEIDSRRRGTGRIASSTSFLFAGG